MKPWIIFSILVLPWLSGCGEDDRNKIAVQAVIEEEVVLRVKNYRQTRMLRCYEKALEEASRRADSILILEARLERDTLGKPPRPEKPERPEIKTLLDSTPIRPLLEKMAEKDSLGKS